MKHSPHLNTRPYQMFGQHFSYNLANVLSPSFVTQDLLCVCTLRDLDYATLVTLQPLHLLSCAASLSLPVSRAEPLSNCIEILGITSLIIRNSTWQEAA